MQWNKGKLGRGRLAGLAAALLLLLGMNACQRGNVVTVKQVIPSGETNIYTNITILFTQAVVTPDRVNQVFDSTGVTVDPPIPCRYRWTDTHTLQLMPTSQLQPSTKYKLTVDPGVVEVPGLQLRGDRTFTFQTPLLQSLGITSRLRPWPGNPTMLTAEIQLTFNAEVNPDSLQQKATLTWASSKDQPIPLTVQRTGAEFGYLLRTGPIERPSAEDSVLVFTIESGLPAENGTIPLQQEIKREFSWGGGEALKVRGIHSRQDGTRISLAIDFSMPVNPTTAEAFIRIEPERPVTYMEQYGGRMLVNGEFKSGERLMITLRKGMESVDGSRLPEDYTQSFVVPDLQPYLTFSAPGSYLSRKGLKNVEMDVVNVDKIHLEVQKVYVNNLVTYLHAQSRGYFPSFLPLGKRIDGQDVKINAKKNEVCPVTVDFSPYLSEHARGLFQLTVRQSNRYWRSDRKTVMVTDLGLIAKKSTDEVRVWVLSTSTLNPVSGARVKLVSSTNQTMKEGVSGENGEVVLSGIDRLSDEFDPYVIIVEKGKDFSYLLFADCEVYTSDFDVDGQPTFTKGLDAYLYGDRGVYRPGEKVHLVSVLRKAGMNIPTAYPVRLEVLGPDGSTFSEVRGRTNSQGMTDFTIDVPAYAQTGLYRANLYVADKKPVGTQTFRVEEFLPDRMKVEVTTDKNEYRSGDQMKIDVTGTMLFGPPAAGRRCEAGVRLESAPFAPKKYTEYEFGNDDRTFSTMDKSVGDGKLDDQGRKNFIFMIPDGLRPPAALRAVVSATVSETGGRAVTNLTHATVYPYASYIGLRRGATGYAKPGVAQHFSYVVVDPSGAEVTAKSLVARLVKITWQTVLQQDKDGHYHYTSESRESVVREINLPSASSGTFDFVPDTWGSYRVVIENRDAGASTSMKFTASGWGYSPWSMEKPDRIDIELDKKEYTVGQTAKVLLKAPFKGTVLLTVERDRVLSSRLIELHDNTAEVTLRVDGSFRPNAYVSALLVRSPDKSGSPTPMRAFGTVPIRVDMQSRRLTTELSAPESVRPKRPMSVNVHVLGGGSTARLTVAAVDEGVLQLTDFTTPDAHGYFYSKRRLEVDSYDIFALLLPEVQPAATHSSVGGDRMMRERDHINTFTSFRVKPVALWSGIVPVENGRATVTFAVPEFNGKLRVMALAVDGGSFGSASRDVTVSEPIVLMPTVPRFVAGGDHFQVPVNVYNYTGKRGTFTVSLACRGAVEIRGESSANVTLDPGAEGMVNFDLAGFDAYGYSTLTFRGEGNGEQVTQEVNLPVRPPVAPKSITGGGSVPAGSEVRIDLPDKWVAHTAVYQLNTMALPALDFAPRLQKLLAYPYGCLEQTVSKAFPLLYFDELAKAVNPDRFKDNAPEYYVEQAIARVVGFQLPSGGFNFWPRGSVSNLWASTYATDFLVEARKKGYSVPSGVVDKAYKYLWAQYKAQTDGIRDVMRGDESAWRQWSAGDKRRLRAYILYVFAKMGKPERGSMNYLLTQRMDKMPPDGRLLLAAAFALSGDRNNAAALLPRAMPMYTDEKRESEYTFSSRRRAEAISLAMLAEIAPDNEQIPLMVRKLADDIGKNHYWTTQEHAWTFIGLGRIFSGQSAAVYTGTISVDGSPLRTFDTSPMTLIDSTLGGKKVTLKVEGTGRCYYFWEARGLPVDRQTKDDFQGIEVHREFLDIQGGSMPMDKMPQGDLIVVRLKIKAKDNLKNVVIDDMLPAGLEIENPRLESQPLPAHFEASTLTPLDTDIRDDRLILFANLPQGREVTYQYAVRAVTAGSFTLPPVTAECMYDPGVRGTGSSGTIEVVKP